MKRFTRFNPGRRALRVLLATALSLGAAAALVAPAGASPPTGPDPALAGASLSVSAHDGLVAGQVITYTVNVPAGHGLFGVTAHLCHSPGPNPYTDPTFGFSNAGGIQCVDGANLDPTVLTPSGPTGTTYEKSTPFSGSELTSGAISWKVGTGTVTWTNDDSFPGSLQCDPSHPCKLVVQADLSGSPGRVYFSQELTFAAAPDAPTGASATGGDNSGTVSFSAGASDGGSPIDFFTVTAGGPCVVSCSVNTPNGTTFSATVTGLTNFTSYPFSVTAHNTAGFTSSVTSAGSATPEPPAPTNVAGSVDTSGGGGKINLTWDYTGHTTNPNLIGFRITTTGTGAPAPFETGNVAHNFQVTGLANGTPYTFVVEASFAGGFHSDPSGSSSGLTPTGAAIYQIVTVDRPQGALVLTQACAAASDSATPYPYPVDSNGVPNPTYPTGLTGASATTCTIDLGHATFVAAGGVPSQPTGTGGYPTVGEGQFFKADGALHQVTLVDTRDSDIGWTVNGVLTSNFTSGANQFSAYQLGWQPTVTDKTPDFSTPGPPLNGATYHNDATKGVDALPSNNAAALTGLGSSRVLASATTGHGLGLAHLDALLHILIPVYAQHGIYTATLQITAV